MQEPTPRYGQSNSVIPNLADWRFNRYLTMQLLPLFYVLLMAGALVAVLGIVGLCFWFSVLAGIIAACLAPLVFLVIAAVIRAALEYLIMAHRIMRIIEGMDALPGQVGDLTHRVEGITSHVDELTGQVHDIHESLMHVRPLLRSAGLPGRLLDALRGPRERR
ncbi:hypothetical protein A11A3_01625 [Alcanivorax hongdengensis A-11-3]|uniref:DUF4282 domain-containing protein n=1 Tax=Alcanivorax hongdengensis A-11-3 TaxID=1177179 RepID=L0WH00_9GAMM|nr:DUF4282 domain-containing protein [Alcanivorax hongdengensis]EKF76153.1 hypothetical protein A11A3_01625 [Alcanivorax hongdengensis A-11-3]